MEELLSNNNNSNSLKEVDINSHPSSNKVDTVASLSRVSTANPRVRLLPRPVDGK